MGKKPMKIITDGLPAYHDAYLKEYWTLKGPRTEHAKHITIRGDKNNNKMERFNGGIRDREKVMRGLKKTDSAILTGYQLFHNYIRSHEGLDGKTPAPSLFLVSSCYSCQQKFSPSPVHNAITRRNS